ncbi:MAG: histidine kinase dimerization/phosphoacceptor domain -containing protein [Thermodesulfobacteriota bacterium]
MIHILLRLTGGRSSHAPAELRDRREACGSSAFRGLQLGEQGDFEQAFLYEDLARDLSAKYPDTFGAPRGMNGIDWCNMHSRSHPAQIVDYCLKSIRSGKDSGDLCNAGLSYGPLMWNLQVQGADLQAIEEAAKECLQFSHRHNLSFSVGLAEAMQAGWIAPMKRGYSPVPMEEKLKAWERDSHVASVGSYFVHMALSHYYFGEHGQARDCLNSVRKYLTGLADNVLKRQWHVFLVLNALKLFERRAGHGSREELLAEIEPLIRKIETWASPGPLLKPYLAFIHAERERVLGGFREARSLYLDAVHAAHEQNYTLLEGHLHQCLGELLLGAGRCGERIHFAEAARLYRKCRAERKEYLLHEKYAECFVEEPEASAVEGMEIPAFRTLPNLDVDYLMKSSMAISVEIEQESLLRKAMDVVLECSGAQHGYLLIEEDGNLTIRAESHIAEKQSCRALGKTLEEAPDICRATARHVYRTGERVVFDDARKQCALRSGCDCRCPHPGSLLCLPVIKQSKKIGILFLENRLTDSVFTEEKIRMTRFLASQAAISLENARLVDEMKKAEELIRKSLREKEVLLKEIHHRVKNNLQIIQSMLSLQLPYIRDAQAVGLFKESQNRIYTMALIHEKLYRSESLANIDFKEYVGSLVDNLFLSYGAGGRAIRAAIDVENVSLEINKIIPCALIINELVSNSLKHAFPMPSACPGDKCEIRIVLRQPSEDRYVLTVGDNGVGLPEDFDLQRSESLGLKLITVLAKQLRGAVEIGKGLGTEFTITFGAKKPEGTRRHV